jgi:hypothetical protein
LQISALAPQKAPPGVEAALTLDRRSRTPSSDTTPAITASTAEIANAVRRL